MSCTTIAAGKKASETDLVLIAHNEDNFGRYAVYRGFLPEADHDLNDPDQAFLPAEEGLAKIPQVPHTFGAYWVENIFPDRGASSSDMFLNRNGVLVTSNSGQDSKPDPNDPALVKEGGIAYNLRRAVGERAESARHGAQIALELLAEWGYAFGGRIYTIADKDEAWSIQTVRGHYYAAARIPDNAVMVMPNHLTIHRLTEFPVSLALDPRHPRIPLDADFSEGAILYPADLVDNAVRHGWFVPQGPDPLEDFDYAFVYQAENCRKVLYNTNRHIRGTQIVLGDPEFELPEDPLAEIHHDPDPRYYPFCVTPKKSVTRDQLREILCSHFETFPEIKTELGPGKSPHLRRGVIVCYGNSTDTTITQFDSQPGRITLWTAFGRSCHQPFVPLHPLSGIPDLLEPMEDPTERLRVHLQHHPERTCWKNNVWWQGFRAFQELADMQFCDIEKPLSQLREEHFSRGKAANAEILKEGGDLKAFDREQVETALHEWKNFAAEHFNLAEIMPLQPIPRGSDAETMEIRFRMPEGQTPAENGMVLMQGMGLLEKESAGAIPGSLKQEANGLWSVKFDARPILAKAYCAGDFDYYLGGINTEGRTFAGQLILTFC